MPCWNGYLSRRPRLAPVSASAVISGSACQAGEPGWRLAVAVRALCRELPGGYAEDSGQLPDFPGGEAPFAVRRGGLRRRIRSRRSASPSVRRAPPESTRCAGAACGCSSRRWRPRLPGADRCGDAVPPSCARPPGEYREDRLPAGFRVPAPVNTKRFHDPEPPAALTVGRCVAHHRAVRRGIRHGDDHRFGARCPSEGYPDRLRDIAAGVLDRVSDQFGCDDRGVVGEAAQFAVAERGPDVEPCFRTDSGMAGSMNAISRRSISAAAPAAFASRSACAAFSSYTPRAVALM
jgi:hypothetical protein